jgi:cytochrome c
VQKVDLVVDNNSSHTFAPKPAADTLVIRRRFALVSVLAAIAAMIGLGFVHPFGNPRAESESRLGTHLVAAKMPANARDMLIAKCADCHSNETHWPLYASIAPGSWLMEWDIVEGRRHLDLSHWDELTPEARDSLAAKIIMEVKSREMPPLQYLALHWEARPTTADVQALASLINTDAVNAAADTSLTGPGDAARGKLVFEKRCIDCHAMAKNTKGPMLAGLFGRKAASVPRFAYSPALKKSGLTWTEATLDKWLTDPDTLVPDTTMEYRVRNAEERRDLIAFLRQ